METVHCSIFKTMFFEDPNITKKSPFLEHEFLLLTQNTKEDISKTLRTNELLVAIDFHRMENKNTMCQ